MTLRDIENRLGEICLVRTNDGATICDNGMLACTSELLGKWLLKQRVNRVRFRDEDDSIIVTLDIYYSEYLEASTKIKEVDKLFNDED